jgi:hypothetical protein
MGQLTPTLKGKLTLVARYARFRGGLAPTMYGLPPPSW